MGRPLKNSTDPVKELGVKPDKELVMCAMFPIYFITNYCMIYEKKTKKWIRFDLWQDQIKTIELIEKNDKVIILKARQQGFTWTVIAYVLHQMIFNPISTVFMFSVGDREAKELLGLRLKGMYDRLPENLKLGDSNLKFKTKRRRPDNEHQWELSNESRAISLPNTGGRSYAGTMAIIDEADYCLNFDEIMKAIEPTVNEGGKLIILSTADKANPTSQYKTLFKDAYAGKNNTKAFFSPWTAHPGRTQVWYDEQVKNDPLARIGIMDNVYEKYPSSVAEALAPKALDKRIPSAWITKCYDERQSIPIADLIGLVPEEILSIPGLEIYNLPSRKADGSLHTYVISGDPAEGNVNSDDSAAMVMNIENGEECCLISGKFEPAVFAAHIDALGKFYHNANLMIERMNHGQAVLMWLKDKSGLYVLKGHDGNPGWLSSTKGKIILYDIIADAILNREVIIHSLKTFTQLAEIEAGELRCPEGIPDDVADSLALASAAVLISVGRKFSGSVAPQEEFKNTIKVPKSIVEAYNGGVGSAEMFMTSPFENGVDLEYELDIENVSISEIAEHTQF